MLGSVACLYPAGQPLPQLFGVGTSHTGDGWGRGLVSNRLVTGVGESQVRMRLKVGKSGEEMTGS